MESEVLEHMFDPFYTTKKQGKGVGLGTTLMHEMTIKHNGDVKVESQKGGGTKFIFEFPVYSLDT